MAFEERHGKVDGILPKQNGDANNPLNHNIDSQEDISSESKPSVNTAGGAAISGNVTVERGDFVGRDQYKTVITEDVTYDVRGQPNPYLGLRAFTYADRAAFGGRETVIDQALAKLTTGKQQTLLFIIGSSGSGKSSFIQAGLLPRLQTHYQERHKKVFMTVFRPSSDPLAMLADVLGILNLPELSLAEMSHLTAEDFGRFLSEHTPKDQMNLLVIDQFEELFTQSLPDQRELLLEFLAALPPVIEIRTHILISLRSDYLEKLFNHKILWDIAKQGVELRAMNLDEMKLAIQQPLWAANPDEQDNRKRFEEALLERLAQDACQDAAYLPLLQVTLQELWKKGSLKLSEYATLTDAIRRHAELVYRFEDFEASQPEKERSSGDKQAILKIFLDLVDVSLDDDPGRDVRRPRSKNELVGSLTQKHRLIDDLIRARLLSAGLGRRIDRRVETVDIIHESLITNWDRLSTAIAEQRQNLRHRARFEHQLAEWLESGRSDDYLLSGMRLAEARELDQQDDIATRGAESDEFILRSSELAESVQRKRVRNIFYVAVGLTIALLIALSAAGAAIWQSDQLVNEKSTSELRRIAAEVANATIASERSTSEARSLLAQQAEGTAVAERSISEAAKNTAIWERNRAEAQAEISLSRQLAVQAEELILSKPNLLPLASLLSIESLRRYPDNTGTRVSADLLRILPKTVSSMTHEDEVVSVAFSPDGRRVVSGSKDGTARIWEVASGREITRMSHDNWVTCVLFSPDGKWVVSGSVDGTARVWEADTGREIARMTHDRGVDSVAFSSNGNWVVSGSSDGVALVWDAATGREISRITHDSGVTSVAFSPDGEWVVSGSDDGTARIWASSSGREVTRITHEGSVTSVAFSPDGQRVVSGSSDRTVRVWDAITGLEITRMNHKDWVTSVAFSSDGKWIVSGSLDNTARVWEVITGREVSRMTHADPVTSCEFSPDGTKVISGSWDGTARVWEANTGAEIVRMTHEGWVTSVAFSTDGRQAVTGSVDRLAQVFEVDNAREVARMTHDSKVTSLAISQDGSRVVSGSEDGSARVWETVTGQEISRMTFPTWVSKVAFSPDGKWVITGSGDSTARVWDAATGREVARMTHDFQVESVAFSPNGKWAVSISSDGTARVWEADTGREVARMIYDGGVTSVAFSPDGRWVVSGSTDGTARLWDAATGRETARLVHKDTVTSVVFSPNGNWVASGSLDGVAHVWEAATGREVSRMTYDGFVTSIAFSPDGRWVVSGSTDGTARVWEAANGREIARMIVPTGIYSVDFSPDGKWLATGGFDNTVRVWEALTGNEVIRLESGGVVNSISFSPDGKWLVSGSEDGTARVWRWRPEDLIDLACSRLKRNLIRTEWQQYLGDRPYRQTCPTLPPME